MKYDWGENQVSFVQGGNILMKIYGEKTSNIHI